MTFEFATYFVLVFTLSAAFYLIWWDSNQE